jgi:hypothetical protein
MELSANDRLLGSYFKPRYKLSPVVPKLNGTESFITPYFSQETDELHSY